MVNIENDLAVKILVRAIQDRLDKDALEEMLLPQVMQILGKVTLPQPWMTQKAFITRIKETREPEQASKAWAKALGVPVTVVYSLLRSGDIAPSLLEAQHYQKDIFYLKKLYPERLLTKETLETIQRWVESVALTDALPQLESMLQALDEEARIFAQGAQEVMDEKQVREYLWGQMGDIFESPTQFDMAEFSGTQVGHISRMLKEKPDSRYGGYTGPVPKKVLMAFDLIRVSGYRQDPETTNPNPNSK